MKTKFFRPDIVALSIMLVCASSVPFVSHAADLSDGDFYGGYDGGFYSGGYDGGGTSGGYDAGFYSGGYDGGFYDGGLSGSYFDGYDAGFYDGGWSGGEYYGGYDAGEYFDFGYDAGFSGYDAGFLSGGYDAGYSGGYDAGFYSGGYDAGFSGGYDAGYSGYDAGYAGGYDAGYANYDYGCAPYCFSQNYSLPQMSARAWSPVMGGGSYGGGGFSVRPSAPVTVSTPQRPIGGGSSSHHSSVTNTHIDNSVRDYSYNDYSYTDNSINGSFNNYNSGNTTIAYVPPTPTYTPAPVYHAPHVALTQIPYTGFDLGPIGNSLYWGAMVAFAGALAYLALYYKGGMLAFAGVFAPARREKFAPVVAPKAPILIEREAAEAKVAPVVAAVRRAGTLDTMAIFQPKDGSMPKIIIDRS